MNRLTTKTSIMGRKHDLLYGCAKNWKKVERYYLIENAVDKLGELEDIEEEIGISLPILFKTLKDGFYIKHNFEIVHIYPDKNITINFWYKTINVFIPPKFFIDCKKGTNYLSKTIDEEYWFKDYGKTWALTKEELENE